MRKKLEKPENEKESELQTAKFLYEETKDRHSEELAKNLKTRSEEAEKQIDVDKLREKEAAKLEKSRTIWLTGKELEKPENVKESGLQTANFPGP